MRQLALIPLLWGATGAVAEATITENSLVPLGMFIGGLAATGAMLWKAGRYTQKMENRMASLERKVNWMMGERRKQE